MILKEYIDLLTIVLKYLNADYSHIKMLELGSQMMRCRSHPAKNYFYKRGIHKHISIDLNGKNGSQRLDLNKPITKFHNVFDISTDFGTIEHVTNQYMAFKNMHDMTRVGGYMIHALPVLDSWIEHAPYHYEPVFFNTLANENKYALKLNEVRYVNVRHTDLEGSICVIFKKKYEDEFIPERIFNDIAGLHYSRAPKRYSY